MYFLLTLFLASLLGIIFMIGRKLLMLQNGQAVHSHEDIFKTQYLEELRHLTIQNIKKHGYSGLVATIRLYVRSTNTLKNKYQEAKLKIKNGIHKNHGSSIAEKKEVSNFLKMISEYKHKIREIKHKIHEEENQ